MRHVSFLERNTGSKARDLLDFFFGGGASFDHSTNPKVLGCSPNGLAIQRKCLTCVQLAFRLATHLRGLAMTLGELKLIRAQVDASFSPSGRPT